MTDAEQVGSERMSAGRALDALVAERVMGRDASTFRFSAVRVSPYTNEDGTRPYTAIGYDLPLERALAVCEQENARGTEYGTFAPAVSNVPHYSTDIAAAWEVVEAMRVKGWDFWLDSLGFPGGEWRVLLQMRERESLDVVADAWGEAPTPALAICRATLAALATEPAPPRKASGEPSMTTSTRMDEREQAIAWFGRFVESVEREMPWYLAPGPDTAMLREVLAALRPAPSGDTRERTIRECVDAVERLGGILREEYTVGRFGALERVTRTLLGLVGNGEVQERAPAGADEALRRENARTSHGTTVVTMAGYARFNRALTDAQIARVVGVLKEIGEEIR